MGKRSVAAVAGLVLVLVGSGQQAVAWPSLLRMEDAGTGVATAACPGNLTLHGVGGSSASEIVLTEDLVARTATAQSSGNGAVTAYAVCGMTPNPVLTPKNDLSDPRATTFQVECDPGSQVHSVAAEILPADTGAVITGIVPAPGLKRVTVDVDPTNVVNNARWTISATLQCG